MTLERLRDLRLAFALLAGAGFWALLVGLVTGEGWLRVPGLAACACFFACALLLDWRAGRIPEPLVEREVDVDPFDEIDWHFPPRIDDRRAA